VLISALEYVASASSALLAKRILPHVLVGEKAVRQFIVRKSRIRQLIQPVFWHLHLPADRGPTDQGARVPARIREQ